MHDPQVEASLEALSPEARADARRAAGLILAAHRGYLAEFNALTAKSKENFEHRAWTQGSLDAGRRVQLYRSAVNGTWRKLQRLFPEQALRREFWMRARQAFLEEAFHDYEADIELTFFYSTMRLAFDSQDIPVEYADDGLAERSPIRTSHPVWRLYRAGPQHLRASLLQVLERCAFRVAWENRERDAALAANRLLAEWSRQIGEGFPRDLQMLDPIFFRDREAYLAGKLRATRRELPVVFALRHEDRGITVDAVLAGKEDMRSILFVSTRSTFLVRSDAYREVLAFLDTLAPERGHPAMCAVLGFTHPARVALNQRLRRHLRESGERFAPAPGRVGMAMVVFSPPTFPYVFKVIRDFSSKQGWMGRAHIMEIYRWVHEMNRGRLMLDAWLYRNLHFPREAFDPQVLQDLLASAPSSVRMDGDTVVLKHVYAQRRVQPLGTFFEQTGDRAARERAIDALGAFIKDLAGMGFFMADCYGLPFNTGLTHASNVTLFDFDDLGPILRHRFRETPPFADEQDELLWNSETDGAWFSVAENDVLVDEWERFLGVPPDLQGYFRARHGDLFTVAYWEQVQRRIMAGKLHFVLPYPPERRLSGSPAEG
ncbi:MAG TPA: isocitrate dehydrogenase kinase/phosphatase AceK regulatory subunit [Bryobacteraceae bacterium]|nr:isocitrate dehydrogenase kinase/phosphatase AceK regulatory subunit [Bryobacteraceae bacterium]